MSYREYNDLYRKAQKEKTGYILCLFDVCNSKTNEDYVKYRNDLIDSVRKLAEKMNALPYKNDIIYIWGDTFCFSVKNQKNVDEKIKKLFSFDKLKLHYISVYFDTFNWSEGNKKYCIQYAIQKAEEESKKHIMEDGRND